MLCAVKCQYSSHELLLPERIKNINQIDIIGIKIVERGVSLNIFVIYVPPEFTKTVNNIFSNFINCLEEFISTLTGMVLVVGDFNLSNLSRTDLITIDNNVVLFNSFLSFLGLHQLNTVVNSNNRILDLVLSNSNCNVTRALEELLPIDKYHPPTSN